MSTILYPYATVDADPALTVSAVRLDGASRPQLIKVEESTIALYDEPKAWNRAEIAVELTCDAERVRAFESAHGPIAAVVVANCLPTNARQPLRLARSDVEVGRWSGTLELDHDNFRNRVALTTTMTATVGGLAHRPVAAAPTWTVHADEPESLRLKGTLRVKWLNFKQPHAPAPARDFPNSTHVLAFTGGVPELWLNSGFDGLEALLKDRKDRRGADKALHDFQRTGIARAVWLALLADALAGVRSEVSDGGSEEPTWPEVPWQVEILKLILPEVAPGKSDRELLSMVVNDWREPSGAGEFFARAEAIVGDVVKANELVRRFVQNYSGEDLT